MDLLTIGVAPILAITGFELLITLGALALPATIVIAVLYFRNQQQRMWHETARLALDKGQPVPVEILPDTDNAEKGNTPTRVHRDVKAGLILIAVAAGMYFGSKELGSMKHASMGVYIPGFIGVALLVNAAITGLTSQKHDDPPKPVA
jgi:hypothetical protein